MSDWIVPVTLGVLSVAGGAGFWGYLQSRKDQPVKQKDADIAAAEKSQQMALAVADDLREDMIRLRADFNAERDARNALSGRFDQLSEHVREQDNTIQRLRRGWHAWAAAWDDMVANWDLLRHRDTPPARPNISID